MESSRFWNIFEGFLGFSGFLTVFLRFFSIFSRIWNFQDSIIYGLFTNLKKNIRILVKLDRLFGTSPNWIFSVLSTLLGVLCWVFLLFPARISFSIVYFVLVCVEDSGKKYECDKWCGGMSRNPIKSVVSGIWRKSKILEVFDVFVELCDFFRDFRHLPY